MKTKKIDIDLLEISRKQIQLGFKRRSETHLRAVFFEYARNFCGRFAPVRPCTCVEPLIHGKELLRSALESLKVSVRNDLEFEDVYREVSLAVMRKLSPT